MALDDRGDDFRQTAVDGGFGDQIGHRGSRNKKRANRPARDAR